MLKKNKTILAMLLALTMLFAMSASVQAAFNAGDQCSVNASALNFRTGPGMNYAVTTSFVRGSVMSVIEQTGDWCKVTAPNGKAGYVASRYLTLKEQAVATEPAKPAKPVAPSTVSNTPALRGDLIISAAASLTDAITEIKGMYEKANPGVNLTLNLAASGTLQQQIEQGAPADVFISAATKQMDALQQKGLIVDATCKDLLKNRIVLVGALESDKVKDFATLENADIIALGEPDSVPAGKYGKEALQAMGMWDNLLDKMVYAKDVRQVLAYVESGNAEAGIVYMTDAKISEKVKILEAADESTHTPVVYPAAVVKASKHQTVAAHFLNYLSTAAAQEVFSKYGFSLVE